MKQTLIEKLREYVENDCEGTVVIDGKEYGLLLPGEARGLIAEIERDYIAKPDHEKALNAMVEAQSGVNEPGYRSAHYVMQEYAKSKGMPFENGDCITDWLNRWFVPRPLYEDGEPVSFDDSDIDWGRIDGFYANAITSDGQVLAIGERNICAKAEMTDEGLIKRKSSKVLDADGVEIEVGDTVWYAQGVGSRDNGRPWTVIELQSPKCIYLGRGYVHSEGEYAETVSGEAPDMLTHREPDSLKKLRDDIKKQADRYEYSGFTQVWEWYDRLAALIERGA